MEIQAVGRRGPGSQTPLSYSYPKSLHSTKGQAETQNHIHKGPTFSPQV